MVVAAAMPCGPAPKRSLAGAKVYWPGRDADLVGVLRRAGKLGVAHLGRRRMRTPNDIKRDLTDAGFTLRRCPFSPADVRLGNEAEWGVTWYWNGSLECLSRVCVDQGTMCVDNWRVIGLADDLDVAVALVRRHEQPWTNEFMAQTVRDTAPGLIKASSYRSDAALRALLRVGIAGLIDAERRARARAAA
ncbi:MAG TPA: hypothetical protein VGX69_01175 [Solirubrobacteraceae bacterium]|nr:hypothetical protein [Solirubrobacteraceae bacterium]